MKVKDLTTKLSGFADDDEVIVLLDGEDYNIGTVDNDGVDKVLIVVED